MNEPNDFEIETEEAVFFVAFTEEDGQLVMTAAGDLDNAQYREAIVSGLRDTANSIEGVSHERSN
jgi:valyl-tRNA synthetase